VKFFEALMYGINLLCDMAGTFCMGAVAMWIDEDIFEIYGTSRQCITYEITCDHRLYFKIRGIKTFGSAFSMRERN
jgi:hypothetical protein